VPPADETTTDDTALLRAKLNQETARIAWTDLQRFFARGVAIRVAPELDLVDTAVAFAQNRSAFVQAEMALGRVDRVEADQARRWLEDDASLWAVVVSPWDLVQQAPTDAAPEAASSHH